MLGYFRIVLPRVRMQSKRSDERKTRTPDSDLPDLALAAPRWRLPTNAAIDARLIFGATLFGLGWGTSGLVSRIALLSFSHLVTWARSVFCRRVSADTQLSSRSRPPFLPRHLTISSASTYISVPVSRTSARLSRVLSSPINHDR